MTRKLLLTGLLFAALGIAGLSAVPADVVYAEGDASIKYKGGVTDDAYIGDVLNPGDSVLTGYDGFVELDQAGLSLKINPETVFALQEKERAGEAAGVFSVVLGSIKFRFGHLTGKEPLIQTGSAIAGVRGTELSVYAGADGSSLILVDSGLVTVEAEGRSVELTGEEGVEVRPGEPPGEKFTAKRDQIDYREWNEQKVSRLLENPAQAIGNIIDRLQYYTDSVDEYDQLYSSNKLLLDQAREEGVKILSSKGTEAAQKYDRETIAPIAAKVRVSFLNVRYFALTALSLRRYVAGRMYILLKAGQMTNAGSPAYTDFTERYSRFLEIFEETIVPHLVEADI